MRLDDRAGTVALVSHCGTINDVMYSKKTCNHLRIKKLAYVVPCWLFLSGGCFATNCCSSLTRSTNPLVLCALFAMSLYGESDYDRMSK